MGGIHLTHENRWSVCFISI